MGIRLPPPRRLSVPDSEAVPSDRTSPQSNNAAASFAPVDSRKWIIGGFSSATFFSPFEIFGNAPAFRLRESDQAQPYGRYQLYVTGGQLVISVPTVANSWGTLTDWLIFNNAADIGTRQNSITFAGSLIIGDGTAATGTTEAFGSQINRTYSIGASAVNFQGLLLDIGHTVTGNLTGNPTSIGIDLTVRLTGSGGARTAVEARGVNIGFTNGGNMTLTDWMGVYIENPANSGTITNQYGMYIESLTAGGTLNIGISIQGATHIFEVPADATDPTGGGGAATGRIPIRVGGATRYIAYY